MASQLPIVKKSPQDLMNSFRNFVANAGKLDKFNVIDLTKTALTLLKSLPATRTAVFEFFSKIFTASSLKYIEGIENEIKTGEAPVSSEIDEAVLTEIHAVLVALISEVPKAWAPFISSWSLDLLGEISTKYTERAHINLKVLNDTMQLWMTCRATRTLVDINTKCMSSLMFSDTEACVDALLDTSVNHSPNFDWVVAHVGSCFPTIVISRVLSCGLKDFCKYKTYEQGKDSSKLKSIIGILGHLAGSHTSDIQNALLRVFETSLVPAIDDQTRMQNKATVPFLLQLCSLSPSLLSSVCNGIKNVVSVRVVEILYKHVDDWCKYFGSSVFIEELFTNLLLSCDTGGIKFIQLLLNCIFTDQMRWSAHVQQTIKDKFREILETLFLEMDLSVRNSTPVKIINSFLADLSEVHKMLLSSNQIEASAGARIVLFLGSTDQALLIQSLIFIIQCAKTNDQLAIFLKILNNDLVDKTVQPYAGKGGHLSVVLEQILSKDIKKFSVSNEETIDLSQMWTNLLLLLRWEKSGKVLLLKSCIVSNAIYANIETITSVFASEILHMHSISDILDILEVPSLDSTYTPSLEAVLNLTQSIINYFFACCADQESSLKIKGFKKCCTILKRLCNYSKVARVLALRELLERSLFKSDSILFGAKINNHQLVDEESDKLLLKQNNKINKTIPLTKHSTVFNGGIIGAGKRKIVSQPELSANTIATNTNEFFLVVKACCALPKDNSKFCDVSLDSVTLLSLLLVQFVSPDVMYNGLPWPEEEFSKVTIERDLFIRKLFQTTPLLWELLNFVATYRPALCYCSVLIRALIATLIHQWKSMGDLGRVNGSEQYKSLIETTVKIMDIMSVGQLLPPPLCYVRDVIPHLMCFEIVSVLRDCIWCYIRDHIPSPALFAMDNNGIYWRDPSISRPPDVYTNSLRIIMQRNIKTLGSLYSQMFINIPKTE